MASLSGFRTRLLLQAALTALFALSGAAGAGGWTIPTLMVAAGAVVVGLAFRPEPQWRTVAVAFEVVAVGYGLVGLGAGHYVPGTFVAAWTLVHLLSGPGAVALEPSGAVVEPYGAEAAPPVPVAVVPQQPSAPVEAALPEPPPAPVASPAALAPPAPVVPPAPPVPAAPRAMAAARTVLPGQ
jgi:hypothetical protein